MDSKGRLHFTDTKGDEFVGMTFEMTGVIDEEKEAQETERSDYPANRKERRAQAAYERSAEGRAYRAEMERLTQSFGPLKTG